VSSNGGEGNTRGRDEHLTVEILFLLISGISIGWGWGETDAGGGGYYQPVVFETPHGLA